MTGETDSIFCNLVTKCTAAAVKNNQLPYYSGATSVEVATFPNTGHNLTLHRSAPDSFHAIDEC